MKTLRSSGAGFLVGVVMLAAGACSKGPETDQAAEDAPGAVVTAAPADPVATGAGDQEFLRQMSDHHQGMVSMAHEAMEKTGSAVQQEATAIDQKQDEEIEQMLSILLRVYSDPYNPVVTPDAQAMSDALASKTGADYDMAFRMNVIEHHKQGIAMIDRLLPRLTREDVRKMAQQMKYDQTGEIREMQAKMAH